MTQSGALQNGPPGKLPTLLCLHGGGTSSMIFNIQSIRIQRALANSFEFLFVDAPFEAPPGPGVMPFFAGCGPFLRWITLNNDGTPTESKKVIEDAMKDEERDIVGVIGFSQGGKLAAGLFLEQQLREKLGKVDGMGKGFRFGVFLNATSPPMLPSGMSKEEMKEIIRIPSLHVVGKEDKFKKEGERLFNDHFDHERSKLIEFEVEHRLPTEQADTARIAEEILRLYRETGGKVLEA
jgi:pimeloyl-ACP methyl ester carboxylesterase